MVTCDSDVVPLQTSFSPRLPSFDLKLRNFTTIERGVALSVGFGARPL